MLGERIGGDSSLILEELGNVAGLSDLTGQPAYLRNVVNQEQVMDAPSDEDVQTLVESARDDALMERRRRNLVVDREPSSFISRTGGRLLSRGCRISELRCPLTR